MCLISVDPLTQVSLTETTIRKSRPPYVSDTDDLSETDPSIGTFIQRCGETGRREKDKQGICPIASARITERLLRLWVPRASVLAWSAFLLFKNIHPVVAMMIQF